MTKKELVNLVAEETGLPKTKAYRAVNAVIKAIRDKTLKEDEPVVIPGLGKFYASVLPARKVVVPDREHPGRAYVVKADPLKVIRFKAYKGGKRTIR